MKNVIISLIAVVALSLTANAQKAPKLLTVDMGVLYNEYYKAQEAQEKFNSSVENAQEEIKAMFDEGVGMTKELNELRKKSQNPATSDEAKAKMQSEIEERAKLIRKKEEEVNKYRQQTDSTLQQRRQSIINLHLSEIREVVIEMSKEKGADLVLNTNGLAVVYFDESYDITKEVSKKLNEEKPES